MAQEPHLFVLGIAQDGGYPQTSCRGACCADAWHDPTLRRHACCMGILDPVTGARWLIDVTPDIKVQWHMLNRLAEAHTTADTLAPASPTGIFLTHAHIGHYTGLMHFGREAASTVDLPVYAMPRMRAFLERNAPWCHLIAERHVMLLDLHDGERVVLRPDLTVTPILVPHREEFSETVGFTIRGPERAALYIPDIDAWELWSHALTDVIRTVDIAFLDGTFYDGKELPGRDLTTIPHPCVSDTMEQLASLPAEQRQKVHFIHLNHTNPLLWSNETQRALRARGFEIGQEGAGFRL